MLGYGGIHNGYLCFKDVVEDVFFFEVLRATVVAFFVCVMFLGLLCDVVVCNDWREIPDSCESNFRNDKVEVDEWQKEDVSFSGLSGFTDRNDEGMFSE